MLSMGVGTTSAQTASAVGEGTFFLYNVGGAAYLTGANNWGTRASLDAHGLDCVVKAADGKYSIEAGNGRYLGKDGYVDKASNDGNYTTWSVTAVEGQDNTYTLQASDNRYLVYDGTGTTCSMVEAAPTTSAGYWKFITKEALQTAADLANASETNPKDVTFLVDGANFARLVDGYASNPGAKTEEKSGPWTYTISGGNFTLSGPQGGSQLNTGCEMYNNTFDLYQTVTVPNGFYYVTCDGFDASGNSRLYAGGEEVAFTGKDAKNRNFANVLNNIVEYSEAARTGIVTVKNGSLKIGVKRTVSGGWTVVDNIRLYCVGLYDAYSGYGKALAAAQTIEQTTPMEGTVLTALQTTISTYGSLTESSNVDDLEAASEALATATANANSSIAAYASAKAYLDKMGAVLDGTNVYTQESYDQYYGTWLSGYNDRTMTYETASGLNEKMAYGEGWHQNTVQGNIDNILLSTWTIGGEQCHKFDKALYINNWSTEGNTDGSEFYTPFFEYWTNDGNSLGANTLVSTLTGLKANTTYSFTIRARVRQTNNQTKIANGITMKVGEGTAVDISAGAIFGTGPFYIGNFSAVGETDNEGKLVCTITVAENSNISWLSFYNCKYTEGEDLSAYIADYEFALSTAQANNTNTAYAAISGKEKADLEAAITTYAFVDNTSKAALIEAKNALEAASVAFVNAAYDYTTLADLSENVATKLGVAWPTVTSTTTAADINANDIIVAEVTAAKAYTTDVTEMLGAWSDTPNPDQKGESWDGTTTDNYYDSWNGTTTMTQSVTLPAGDYALIFKCRASATANVSVTDGTNTVKFAHKGNTGRGIATNGTATFADGETYARNGAGQGWEYRVLTFTSDGTTATTLTFNWNTKTEQWAGLDDIELRANLKLEFADNAELPNYAPGTYTVNITRTIKADFNTVVLPFDLTANQVAAAYGSDTEVYGYSENSTDANNVTVNFTKNDGSIKANTPVLIKATVASNSQTFEGVQVVAPTDAKVSGNFFDFVGLYAPIEAIPTGDYFIGNGALYKSEGATSIKAFRAYLKAKEGAEARIISFAINDKATAIEGIEIEGANDGKIYNLKGQEVKNPQKGVYIQNGKTIIIK